MKHHVIRISDEAYEKLRKMSYEQNRSMTDIMNGLLKVKKVERELTMVEKMLLKVEKK